MATDLRSVHIRSTGLELHALERNPRGRPSVLFLHGWLDHGHGFDPLIDALPASWRTLALDFRGHGQSAHLREGLYHFPDYLADLEAAVQHLGPPVHLVGHSMGGAVSLMYAAARPEAVRSVTAVDNLGPIGAEALALPARLTAFVADLGKPLRKRTYATLEAAVARVRENNSSLPPEAAELLTRYGTQPVPGGVQFTFDPALRHHSALVLDEEQILELLRAVRCPVQIIHGTHGLTLEDAQMKERLSALRSPPVQAVPGGHHVHLDRPAEVAACVQRFVERL
jgi:pimeloyl-ACP methyl ester carboxylesterase